MVGRWPSYGHMREDGFITEGLTRRQFELEGLFRPLLRLCVCNTIKTNPVAIRAGHLSLIC